MPDFELNKADWYTVETVEENAFLNDKLDSDQYGRWYSVKFVGDAQKINWMTKTTPEKGAKYWGWLEKTSTGKSVKFKWDKQNAPREGNTGSTSPNSWQPRDDSHIRAQWAIGQAMAASNHVDKAPLDQVEQLARELFAMVDRVKDSLKEANKENVEQVMGVTEEPVDMSDIPF